MFVNAFHLGTVMSIHKLESNVGGKARAARTAKTNRPVAPPPRSP